MMIQNAVWIREKGIRHRIFHEKVCGQCEYKANICTDYELEENLLRKERKDLAFTTSSNYLLDVRETKQLDDGD